MPGEADIETVIHAHEMGYISGRQAILMILSIRVAEVWADLPDDPFDISGWLPVLTPEARDALEAICSG